MFTVLLKTDGKKKFVHNLKVLKKILAQPKDEKKILTKTKLPNPPPSKI